MNGLHLSDLSSNVVAMTEFERLHEAAARSQEVLNRVAGISEQIASGEWDSDLTEQQARNLADAISEVTEIVRASRSAAGSVKMGVAPAEQWRGLLPFNRKERFFTGTVFPALVSSTGCWHLQRCLNLFGVPASVQAGEYAKVQLLTEYGFAESVFTVEDKARWGTDFTRETPDIVLVGPDWLLAIEAKMYHNPTATALHAQMAAQRPLIDHWQEVLGLPETNVVHALLLPQRLADRERAGLQDQRVVTWEDLLETYRPVAPPYWTSVLQEGLDRHSELESRLKENFTPNAEGIMTGQAIVEAWRNDALTIGYVGRRNGLHGYEFTTDISEGKWPSQKYQVRSEPIQAKNWMSVAEFLAAVTGGTS